jgi:hypothetical protein
MMKNGYDAAEIIRPDEETSAITTLQNFEHSRKGHQQKKYIRFLAFGLAILFPFVIFVSFGLSPMSALGDKITAMAPGIFVFNWSKWGEDIGNFWNTEEA